MKLQSLAFSPTQYVIITEGTTFNGYDYNISIVENIYDKSPYNGKYNLYDILSAIKYTSDSLFNIDNIDPFVEAVAIRLDRANSETMDHVYSVINNYLPDEIEGLEDIRIFPTETQLELKDD